MKPLGVGILGCGVISTIYMRNMALFPALRLVACASQNGTSARAQAQAFAIPHETPAALLARPDVDVILNLTPPAAHFETGMAALAAGKHLFTEKPLVTTLDAGKTLAAEAEKRNLRLGCAPDTFLGGAAQHARHLLDSGAIGRVLGGSVAMLSHGMEHWHPDPGFYYQPGGGPVMDMGPYYLTTLIHLLGPIASVQSLAQTPQPHRTITAPGPTHGTQIPVTTPTTLLALLDFAAGPQLTFQMSWDVWRHTQPGIELWGTEGAMRLPDPNWFGGNIETTTRDSDWTPHPTQSRPYATENYRGPAWPPTRPAQANYRGLGLAEMAHAIAERRPHRASAELALHALEVMQAIHTAAATGTAIPIASRPDRPAPFTDLPNSE